MSGYLHERTALTQRPLESFTGEQGVEVEVFDHPGLGGVGSYFEVELISDEHGPAPLWVGVHGWGPEELDNPLAQWGNVRVRVTVEVLEE